jgi:hypothetical protein
LIASAIGATAAFLANTLITTTIETTAAFIAATAFADVTLAAAAGIPGLWPCYISSLAVLRATRWEDSGT